MKYCNRLFEGLHVYPNGDVRVCGWSYVNIGNLLEDDFEDIWHGEMVEKIRAAAREGSYKYCCEETCQYCANDSLEDLSEEEFNQRAVVPESPKFVNAACDYICNHACPSCRHGIFKPDEEYKKNLSKIQHMLMPVLNKADQILMNGNGDLFASKYMMKMLDELNPVNEDAEIWIESNGVLFTEQTWERMKHLKGHKINLTITPNSYDRRTYKYLSGGFDDLEKLENNLRFIKSLREKGDISWVGISIVVQDSNFRQLPDFTRRSIEEFGCDLVVIKPIFYWFGLTLEEYWHKDILNPKHPYFDDYMDVLKDPILKHPKAYFWGGDEIHPARNHPAGDFKQYFDVFANILKNENPEMVLEEALKKKGCDEVAIYGTNDMAEMMYRLLKRTEIKFSGFIDRDAKTEVFCGEKVTKADTFNPDMTNAILVSNFAYLTNIARDLDFWGYHGRIIPFNEIMDESVS